MNRYPNKILVNLISKYCQGKVNSQEENFLDKYYSYFDKGAKISDSLTLEEKEILENKIFKKIKSKIENPPIKSKFQIYLRKSYRYAAAAILVLVVVGTLFLIEKKPVNDIGPGSLKALLTLDDGSTIELNNSVSGTLAIQGKTKIIKQESGLLTYNSNVTDNTEKVGTNVVTTPLGGEYSLTLPDGTRAWLNAASSIKFPTAFTGKERIVEVSGEVYFEVHKEDYKPFIVKTNDLTEIKVLGTHFNINAYPDEGVIRTTLLEGSVLVTNSSGSSVTLFPGQQSISGNNETILVQEVNIESAIAWKYGVFQFNSQSIDEIMRQISRWYNVEVTYLNDRPQGQYSGVVSRNTNLSEVLEMLQLSGIKFKIEGQSLTVL